MGSIVPSVIDGPGTNLNLVKVLYLLIELRLNKVSLMSGRKVC